MTERDWMYSGWARGKSTDEWFENTKEFLDVAFGNSSVVQNGEIKCPCADCRNYTRKNRDVVELHLCKFGFKRNYTVWTEHGDRAIRKEEILAAARQHDIRPSNSLSYQDLLRRNQQLKKRCKKVDVMAKHPKVLCDKMGIPVPDDLKDDFMDDSDPMTDTPQGEDHAATPLGTGSSHAEATDVIAHSNEHAHTT